MTQISDTVHHFSAGKKNHVSHYTWDEERGKTTLVDIPESISPNFWTPK
jgi:hypothetical protein